MSNSSHAVYSASSGTQSFHHSLPPLPHDVPAKTAYLSKLRESVRSLQTDMNVFLTERMDEDKKSAEVSEKEAKEEENYGEENAEEDS